MASDAQRETYDDLLRPLGGRPFPVIYQESP